MLLFLAACTPAEPPTLLESLEALDQVVAVEETAAPTSEYRTFAITFAQTLDHSGGEPPGVIMKRNAAPEGPTRLVQPEEVAELVWEAYGSDRVHWYIPAEMEGVDKARAGGVEPLRDQFKKAVLEG